MGADTFTVFVDTRVAGLNGTLAFHVRGIGTLAFLNGGMTKVGVTFAATLRPVTMSAGSMREQPAPVSRNSGSVETIIFRTIEYQVQVMGDKLTEFRV